MAGAFQRDFDGNVLTARTDYLWFQTVKEIEDRPRFCAALQIADGELSNIIGAYRVPANPPFHCGLNGCNQPHQKGFLIADKSGRETVCGNVCGRRKLGAEFVELAKRFDATLAQAQKQQTLADLQSKAAESLDIIYKLESELKLVYSPIKAIRQEFRQEASAEPLIRNLIREGGTIKRPRQLSEREREISGNPKVRFVNEVVGQVRGVQALETFARIANIVDADLRGKVNAVARIKNVEDVKGRELTELSSAVQRMPAKFAEVREFLSIAEDFLAPVNFQELTKITMMERANERKLLPIFDTIRPYFGRRPTGSQVGRA